MKKIIIAVLLALVLNSAAYAKLPATYKEFKARYQTEGKTIEGAVKLYFEAVFAFINENTRKEAGKMLRYALYSDRPIERSTYYATFVERMKDPDYNFMFRSYAEGATPENDYAMSPDDFEIMYAREPFKDPGGYMRVPLESSGSDSERIIWVKNIDGLWYVINNAATYVQVKDPKHVTDKKKRAHDADFDDEEEEDTTPISITEPKINAPLNPAPTEPADPGDDPGVPVSIDEPKSNMPPEDGFDW